MKKQYTIRGIDKDLDRAVRETAAKYEVSVNKAAVGLMKKGAGLGTPDKAGGPPYHDMDDLAGTLSHEDAGKLLKHVKDSRQIDIEIWK